jgi:flagellar L-ring protein precursor FlgH
MTRPGLFVFVGALATGCYAPPRALPLPPNVAIAAPQAPTSGSLWHADLASNYLFGDVRARFPGDLLTVVIAENAEGKKDASTQGQRDSSISASVDDFFGLPASAARLLPTGFNPSSIMTAQTKHSWKGDGSTSRTGTLTASITVRVSAVDTNGNLYVQGDKIVAVNGENQHIVLSGTVRPEDITTDNSVPSSRVGDARISLAGVGPLGDKQNTPFVHRALDWMWPF